VPSGELQERWRTAPPSRLASTRPIAPATLSAGSGPAAQGSRDLAARRSASRLDKRTASTPRADRFCGHARSAHRLTTCDASAARAGTPVREGGRRPPRLSRAPSCAHGRSTSVPKSRHSCGPRSTRCLDSARSGGRRRIAGRLRRNPPAWQPRVWDL